MPLLFAGIRTAAVFVVSTTTIASLAGFSGSLGDVIANETSYHFSGVLGAAICVAALALLVEGLLMIVQRLLTPRGLRLEALERAGGRAARGGGRLATSQNQSFSINKVNNQEAADDSQEMEHVEDVDARRLGGVCPGGLIVGLAACGSSSKSSSSSSSATSATQAATTASPAATGRASASRR